MDHTNHINMSCTQDNCFDYKKLKRNFKIGLLGAIIILIGDFLMGWGLKDPSLSGIEATTAQYLTISDQRMFYSSLCGLIGVPLALFGHYSIYSMIKPYSKRYSILYGIGMLGFLNCGGAGVHVSSIEAAYFYKYMHMSDPSMALDYSMKFISYFLSPLYAILITSWIIMVYAHIRFLICKCSPYKRNSVFASMLVGTLLASLVGLIGNYKIVNAIVMGAFSFGNIWTLVAHYKILDKLQETTSN